MSTIVKNIPRRQCIPIIYTRGTHYDVGFDVVITFLLYLHKSLSVFEIYLVFFIYTLLCLQIIICVYRNIV